MKKYTKPKIEITIIESTNKTNLLVSGNFNTSNAVYSSNPTNVIGFHS